MSLIRTGMLKIQEKVFIGYPMIRREWFFLLERLHITPAERRLVLTLTAIVVTLTILLIFVHPHSRYNPFFYASRVQLFQKKIAEAKHRDSMRMARFYNLKALNVSMAVDTSTTSGSDSETKTTRQGSIPSVNINTAGVDSLVFLPGIGPKTAKKIVDYRKANGAFISPASIMKVKGIGEKKLANMMPYIRVK